MLLLLVLLLWLLAEAHGLLLLLALLTGGFAHCFALNGFAFEPNVLVAVWNVEGWGGWLLEIHGELALEETGNPKLLLLLLLLVNPHGLLFLVFAV